jgi:hypothetical protein
MAIPRRQNTGGVSGKETSRSFFGEDFIFLSHL